MMKKLEIKIHKPVNNKKPQNGDRADINPKTTSEQANHENDAAGLLGAAPIPLKIVETKQRDTTTIQLSIKIEYSCGGKERK